MALTLQSALLVRQKALDFYNFRDPQCAVAIRALFEAINAKNSPDLAFISIDYTGNADIVIADVACRLYAWVLRKPAASTVNAWAKYSDHATTVVASGDGVMFLVGTSGGNREYALTYQNGLPNANGISTASHTAVDGSTDSQDADAATGYMIIGAA